MDWIVENRGADCRGRLDRGDGDPVADAGLSRNNRTHWDGDQH